MCTVYWYCEVRILKSTFANQPPGFSAARSNLRHLSLLMDAAFCPSVLGTLLSKTLPEGPVTLLLLHSGGVLQASHSIAEFALPLTVGEGLDHLVGVV